MPQVRVAVQTGAMNANQWLLLGALAGLAGVAINKRLRLARRRRFAPLSEYSRREARARASIDDVPTLREAAAGRIEEFDESVAPQAPL